MHNAEWSMENEKSIFQSLCILHGAFSIGSEGAVMLAWAWDWLWWLAWYAVVAGGWLAWFRAHQRAERLDRELTVMANALRYRERTRT
jgi:hypothetical protein